MTTLTDNCWRWFRHRTRCRNPQFRLLFTLIVFALAFVKSTSAVILTPPYFNLAEGRKITASATCGEDTEGPELYCKLVGANAENEAHVNLIQGQVCDYCDPSRPDKRHPPEFAVDGMETWWQSPPLSRGMKYNEVNLTIDLGQEFHVAYVFVRMGNSPRPGLWVLEKSSDHGKTYTPWQYFSDSAADCETYFGKESLQPITRDDSVICSTEYSKIVPLEGGEIPISLLNNRPSANMYFNSSVLQEWTRATNVRFRLLRTKNLLGHLMSVARQDPTVTRRYFYSIKDISIGGRCMCNGHADTCDIQDPQDPKKLLCRCQHNTCGPQCASCCPGFEQKAWRISKAYKKFECEPCNCFNHTTKCEYDSEIDAQGLSLDIHGKYEGGGRCLDCQHNTEGINCNRCKPKFYRPSNKVWNDIDVCQPCNCNVFYSTGNCSEGTGKCECRKEFTPPNCDSCNYGYFDYPTCRPCECDLQGTRGNQCEARDGQCYCKHNYAGTFCKECADTFYQFPDCISCECNEIGSRSASCNQETGNCSCKSNYRGRVCDECEHGYFNYPTCSYCDCDVSGTETGVCDKSTGKCLCREGYGGERCDQCLPGFYGYPNCRPCNCSEAGSASQLCDTTGKCPCLSSFAGRTCDQCSPGYYKYPECLACNCDVHGAIGISCDNDGKCQCSYNFDNFKCDACKEGFYNFPICEDCNCNPAGVAAAFAGCGSVPLGELCECKTRVQGRICDQCRPLFWNLQLANPEGCESCDCHTPGVVGGVAVCDPSSGQCICKPSVEGRRCSECLDGTYDLQLNDLFGCQDCDCDIGGSINEVCDKTNGQCPCQARINGRTCREPLQAHYFPTLYQFKYEVEDGRTPSNALVRYRYIEEEFPSYSWKGYATFSTLQNEVLRDVYIEKPSLYRMILRYVNPNDETVNGLITINPDSSHDTEQKFEVQFKPAKIPTFVTVSKGAIPSPLVMNPGRWTVSIKSKNILLLDYFVLLPEAYYEATILTQHVKTPCKVGENSLCRQYSYPNVSHFDAAHGDGGFIIDGDFRESLTEFYTDREQLSELDIGPLALLGGEQNVFSLNLTVTKPGQYILLITYITPVNIDGEDGDKVQTVNVTHEENKHPNKEFIAVLNSCTYKMLCRQVVTDNEGRIKHFHFNSNFNTITLTGDRNAFTALKSVVAIPHHQWSLDYIHPKSVCVQKDGKCVSAKFPNAPQSKKVRFEIGNEEQVAKIRPPNIYDNNSNLIYLDHNESMVDIGAKVSNPGYYVFVVHYYQPNYPEFDLKVLIQNGQFYEARLPLSHCPSNSGCRAVITQEDGNNRFSLTENFVLTLKEPNHQSVWLDYLVVVPAELFNERILTEENFDHTIEFISSCGNNHFYINTSVEGFCKDSVFSLTADYNNGALPCDCDYAGSLSFECEKFGGQCQCKHNVIGRKCELCKTGYYGFPDCKPCNCPSTAFCEPHTGQCICPAHVTGENCDQCEPFTYGFDPLIGCEPCNCNPLGVVRDMQCDLFNGNCTCKRNIVNRACDKCETGFYAFPYCEKCHCDLRGTTLNICGQESGECYCKQNVRGTECDFCAEGTFNLQETNEEGCTKCFCFGKTIRCTNSLLYRTQLGGMQNWTLHSIVEAINMSVSQLDATVTQINSSTISSDLVEQQTDEEIFYLSAPELFLGNKLTSYGGFLNYTIMYVTSDTGSAMKGADLILYGRDTYLLHHAYEQPPPNIEYFTSIQLIESNFVLPNNLPANREHIMTVLENLKGIYIRSSYWLPELEVLLSEVSLDSAQEQYIPNAPLAVSVEQCQCPPNYRGLSCEECAPGYWRSSADYCAPCQCNGHSDECDVNTGVCLNCRHNTRGDHCEMCAIGYHGNALQGTPMDCLICACPLPIPSNNFATGCEVSANGEEISCDCLPGYYGATCESCAAGYFGQPKTRGATCELCSCSGNINPDEPESCDSVTGECLRCLNNTFGEACALCAPGYYGDAVVLKDCQACACDSLGTQHCDSYSGTCKCLPNVVGEKCDTCLENHYGFTSGQGCRPCNCQSASESDQCEDATGQCRCRKGVTGRTCNQCAPGFWKYSPEGCETCGCNKEYSLGFRCNAVTGQCECLPGVLGEKCDHCPYRWVLILDQGCFECDKCTHNLLDTTDYLKNLIDPVISDFETVASGYFTSRRLTYINNTYNELKPLVNNISVDKIDILNPILLSLEPAEQEAKNLHRISNFSSDNAVDISPDADKVRNEALNVFNKIQIAAVRVNDTINEIDELSFDTGNGPRIDQALLEAEHIVKEIRAYNFSENDKNAVAQLEKAEDILETVQKFSDPIEKQTNNWKAIEEELNDFNKKLDDLSNYTNYANNKVAEMNLLSKTYRGPLVYDKVNNIEKSLDEAEFDLSVSADYIKNASKLIRLIGRTSDELKEGIDEFNDIMNEFNKSIITPEEQFELDTEVDLAEQHAMALSKQAELLDHLLSDTRNISGDAVGAANAYKNIVNATDSARKAADEAFEAAVRASDLLEGLEDKSYESFKNASDLLEEANTALFYAQTELKPQLKDANQEIGTIERLSNHSKNEYKKITDALDRLGDQNYADVSENAIEISLNADAQAKQALDSIGFISKNIKNDLETAKQLQKDTQDAKKNIQQVESNLNEVNKILPNIANLIDELGPKQANLQNTFSDIDDKLRKLKHQISVARDLANRVNVARKFAPNTTLELRNPPNLVDQGTSTHVSFYFKTDKLDGFLLYLGNPIGTNLRRTKSDDYMALEIHNGYPTLSLDVGMGRQYITNNKFVSDNQTYQAIVERTGPNITFIIKEELPDGEVVEHKSEDILDGVNTIFNLDQKQSRLYVGGYPASAKIQEDVKYSNFDGEIEDLVIGNQRVGLWNFVDGDNHFGGVQRNKLIGIDSNTGYRFNGNGYAILSAKPHHLSSRTEIRLNFTTSEPDGLMFLVGDETLNIFMSIEIRKGKVLFQYNLGDGVVSIRSAKQYNDGIWHTVKASRDFQKGMLEIGDEKLQNQSGGKSKTLKETDLMFIGGYPLHHKFSHVTNADFDGCIDNLHIRGTPVNLRSNLKAFGVVSGCPVKYATLVSFDEEKPGYIHHPNISSANAFQFSLKFKTEAPTGLIFYATDRDQTSGVSLGLVDGILFLISQRLELETLPHTRYNDNEWHVVTVTHNEQELRMDIDDWDSKVSDASERPLRFMYGDMFIGGLPEDYISEDGTVPTSIPFTGCLGDAMLNGLIINFASSSNKRNAILGRCVLDKISDDNYDDLHSIPKLDKDPSKAWWDSITTTEKFMLRPDKPSRGDGGDDEDRSNETATESEYLAPKTTVRPLFHDLEEPKTLPPPIFLPEEDDDSTEESVTSYPDSKKIPDESAETTTIISTEPRKTEKPEKEQCALPMVPSESSDIKNGYRYGTQSGSRLEYDQHRGKYKNQYDFSIDFRTTNTNGLIFYVADVKHLHFVALYLVSGKLKYVFNCGMGPVILESDQTYNDGSWHTAVFSRNQTDGKLVVDDRLAATGHSNTPSSRHLNISPPYYLGAVPKDIEDDVKFSLKNYDPFEGCIRNFQMNGKPMQSPRVVGAVPCMDNTELGTFFGSGGGYVKLKESFNVGVEIDIVMDIKPRNISGLLMSVHGKRDYLVLQMVEGVIKLIVNNGKGPIEAAFRPVSKYYFCDGQWHTIQAIKSKNVASLSVDKTFADAGVGEQHSTDTKYALFLGGHHLFKQHQPKKIRGVQTYNSFVGCIRNLHIDNKPVPIETKMASGDVSVGICPSN